MWTLLLAALLAACAGSESASKDTTQSSRYHPDGWSEPDVHGLAAKEQEETCTACHGADLSGGVGDSCDSCHTEGWRTDCTFCHGGVEDQTGAPPDDIDGSTTGLSFPEHTVHVQATIHAAWDCDTCHTRPTDVLSEGHVFIGDTTPGVAEVTAVDYDGAGTCSNLYCHSDGKGNLGTVASGTLLDCAGCHGDADAPGTLSGVHADHLAAGATCAECHADTAASDTELADPAQHVDGDVDVAFVDDIAWDGATCTGTCHGVDHSGSGWTSGDFHPDGWDDPAQHGLAAKLQTLTCTTCHGADLTGGVGDSCDSCHTTGWRTDCTYCHGGTDDTTGAPPVDIDGSSTGLSFPEHTVHVEETIHVAYDCTECHTKPTDVLSEGHVFLGDTTPGAAELTAVDYDGAGTCSNLYCHSDGQGTLGTVVSGTTLDCAGCHGDADAPGTLSGVHAAHFDQGATCDECHADTAGSDTTIADPALHVDGAVETAFPSGMVYDGTLCTGSCHGVDHDAASWPDALFHPVGWDDAAQHGTAANLGEDDCTTCHGTDLGGGTSGTSCDACHTTGWRTDCTFCHGGTDDTTGAPPVDIDGRTTDLSFPEHPVHVETTIHAAYDCTECHQKPMDVLSTGHVFLGDTTPGVAEVTAVDYDGAGTCSNLYCHSDGRGTLGTVSSGEVLDCAGCHGDADAPGTLSGVHAAHFDQGATCDECHATAASDTTIAEPTLHVDRVIETAFPSGMVYDGSTCTGTCHGADHAGSGWSDGTFHPAGFDAAGQHGQAANHQSLVCTDCHGADLTGGTSGTSCDSCHTSGWRTDCTYCHGGTDNGTGAPPVDLDGATTGLAFAEHTVHVEDTDLHLAVDCTECHTKPTDVLSDGHVFVGDTTPGVAEVLVDYDGAGTCSNTWCHSDGRGTSVDVASGTTLDCAGCHGDADAPGTLSSVHAAHFDQGATCDECHATAASDTTIADPALHVDHEVETAFPSGMVYDGSTCTGTCHGVDHTASTWTDGGFHPSGWDDASAHGYAADLGTEVCTDCHGADLAGGTSGQGCDECHTVADWRTDCTYCHGGTDDSTGAPPDGFGGHADATFGEHHVHVEDATHPAWSCDQCHQQPEDVLSAGHVFIGDTTPGAAETDLGAGLSAAGTWDGASCTNLYCHSDGQGALGTVSTGVTLDCTGCHGDAATSDRLSAAHAGHLDVPGVSCGDCHAATVTGATTLTDAGLHVDGTVETSFPSGMVWDGAGCTGTCHGVDHGGSSWTDGGFHPDGFDAGDVHGLEAKLQTQVCTDCHGADLGGDLGSSCDTCHEAGWRTDCTWCHGGTDDTTGAPPADIDGSTTGLSFPEHAVHVEAGAVHAEWDCTECHTKPTDVLSDGHIFVGDSTPAVAEVDFTAGLSADGAYDGAGTCSNLYCHSDGQGTLGTVHSGDTLDCAGCHGDATAPATLSTVHAAHLGAGASCEECHADTAASDTTLADVSLHVDGLVETAFPSGMVWDGSGCTGTCHGVDHAASTWTVGGFHPAGWDDPDAHGLAAKLQTQDCTDCHGTDLSGGISGTSCDSCHTSGWRTDCTWCHGGTDDTTGAPPVDIDGSTTGLSFPEHPAHVEAVDHGAYDCTTCHTKPTDVLTSGHVFVGDTTPGVAEVTFAGGLSPAGTWDGAGTCSNLYCHGDGNGTLGSVSSGDTLDCGSCHGDATAPGTLSTVHDDHLDAGATCGDCHATTASGSDTIVGDADHVDGLVENSFPSGMVYDGTSCSGTCHGVDHDRSTWTDGGFHPSGWDDPDEHGLAAKLQEQTCTDCHGADLTGGTSGTSCDTCHAAGWRTDCTYCHGGTDNTTGAPPVDIDGSSSGLSFEEHTVHVEADSVHAAWDCGQCHTKPTDVLTSGHLFVGDSTPAVAEVNFTGGLSSAGTYAGSGSCSNLYCHGNGKGRLGSPTTGSTTTCSSCHGSSSSYSSLGGHHSEHLEPDKHIGCEQCHAATVSSSSTISDVTKHVDGSVETSFPSGMVYTSGRCTGTCHSEYHGSRRW